MARRCWRRRRPGRSTSSGEPAWICCRPRSRSPQNRGGDAPLLLLQAARKLETLDVRLSRDTYLDAWAAALFAGGLAAAGGSLLDVSRAAATAPDPADPPLPCDLLLDGLALVFTDGRPAAAPVLRRAVAAFASNEVSVEEVLRWGWLATRAANLIWDYDRGLEIGCARGAARPRLRRARGPRRRGQRVRSGRRLRRRLRERRAAGRGGRRRQGGHRDPHRPARRARPRGLRGQEAEASELIDGVITEAAAGGQGTAVQYAHWANSVLMNGLGRYEEALAAAVEASEHTPELYIASWALSELIEAATRTENAELADGALARLGEQTEACDTDWALGIHARSRALLSEGEDAERLYREAIDRLGAHETPARSRPSASALRGVAAPRESPRRRARAAASGTRAVRDDRHGGVRRACPGRAAGHGREGAQADAPRRAMS